MQLEDFFRRLSPKSRLMIFLMSFEEFNYDKVRQLTCAELAKISRSRKFQLPEDLKRYSAELIVGKADTDRVFTSTGERPYSARSLDTILENAHQNAGVAFQGRESFAKNMAKNRLKTETA